MEKISIDGSQKLTTINFDQDKGLIEIRGKSIPENPKDFYQPLIDWVEEYSGNPSKITTVNIKLEYFNTSSSKWILNIFKRIVPIYKDGKDVVINWYYDENDEDIYESGEDYQSIVKIPFNIIET